MGGKFQFSCPQGKETQRLSNSSRCAIFTSYEINSRFWNYREHNFEKQSLRRRKCPLSIKEYKCFERLQWLDHLYLRQREETISQWPFNLLYMSLKNKIFIFCHPSTQLNISSEINGRCAHYYLTPKFHGAHSTQDSRYVYNWPAPLGIRTYPVLRSIGYASQSEPRRPDWGFCKTCSNLKSFLWKEKT